MLARSLMVATVAAFVLTLSPPASANGALALSAAKKHTAKRHVVRRAAGGQIACTIYGCHRIPARCTPTTEFDWRGIPTGFDAVVCR